MGAKVGGKGGGKFDLGQNSDINVTPFVDVMLVLLIIFMVTAPLATVSIKIDLPPPQPNQPPPPEKPVFISIQPYGKLYIRGTDETTLAALPADLLAALGGPNPREKQVLIQASRGVIYKDFMAVLNVLQGNGFYKIGLISENLDVT